MRSLYLHGNRDLQIHEEPMPHPQGDESLLRVAAVGLCGSDLHWYEEAGIGDARLVRPLILGHEFAGRIDEPGGSGPRVVAEPSIPCMQCEFCLEGNPNLCPNVRFAGHSLDGALREYMAWPTRLLYPLPDTLTDVQGAMLEPLGVAIHAVDLAHLRAGMSIGVFGCGPIGLLVLQVSRAAGATTRFATDKLTHRLDAAQELGATSVHMARDDLEESAEILAATFKRGVDVAFECAGENAAVQAAVRAAKPGGTVILAGIPPDDNTNFTASIARRKGLTLKLSRRMKPVFPRAIRLVQQAGVDVASIVTHRFPLSEFDQAFRIAHARTGIKVVIEP
jgi:L-iditol 2-dehydrogenase